MKFKKLTDVDKQYIATIYHSQLAHKEKVEMLSSKFSIAERTVRSWWTKLDLQDGPSRSMPSQLRKVIDRVIPEDTDVVFVTTCQNTTMVNVPMLENMVAYADYLKEHKGKNVEIVVIPGRYRNPTSPTEDVKRKVEQWWVDDVEPYLYYSKIEFGDCLIAADSRIRPTATNPLTGYESLAFENHLVIGHPRLHLKVMPRFRGDELRVMCTTGYISNKNYSTSKAGDKGFIHHSYGFTVVEKGDDGRCMIPRIVKVNSQGNFSDIIYEVDNGEVKTVESTKGFVWGDIHHQELDEIFSNVTFRLLSKLKPKVNVLHDVLDGGAFNPHERKDFFKLKQTIREGKSDVKREVNRSLKFIKKVYKKTGAEVKVVQSNHDLFLDRLINDMSWKRDLHNSEAYLEYALIQQTKDLREYGGIYGYLVGTCLNSEIIEYIPGNKSFRISGYQCGYHGDRGANGARGNINSFRRYNSKMIIGHSHSPAILDGVTLVGVTCKLWQYYNSNGMSSWAYAHSVIHNNGKNQLLIFNDDYQLSLLID